MKTVLSIFWNDLKRLMSRPVAVGALILVILLSAAFCALSVRALWSPHENAGELKVAIVNNDAGYRANDAGSLNIGSTVVDTLSLDKRFKWEAVDAQRGENGLSSGEYYAEIVLPEDFSQSFAGFLSGETEQPIAEYRINRKYNTAAFEATDVGATALDTAINDAFAAVIANAAAGSAGADVSDAMEAAQEEDSRVQKNLNSARKKINKTSKSFSEVSDSISEWRDTVKSAQTSLGDLQSSLPDLKNQISDCSTSLADVRSSVHGINGAYASVLAEQGSEAVVVSDAVIDEAETAASDLTAIKADVDSIAEQAEKALEYNNEIINALEAIEEPPGAVETVLEDLKDRTSELEKTIEDIKAAQASIDEVVGAADAQDATATDDDADSLENLRSAGSTFVTDVMPRLETSLDTVALALGSLSGAADSLDTQINQSRNLLDQLDSAFSQAENVLNKTDDALTAASDSLESARTSLATIADSDFMKQATELSGANSANQAKFTAAPVTTKVEEVFSLNSFGSMVAPFYACLAIWLGVLMLAFLFKTDVNPEFYPRMRPWHACAGRFLVFAFFSMVLATVVCAVSLLCGVEAANAGAFIAAGVVAAIAFAGVAFAVVYLFKHLGKAILVVLLVAQIPGASGMYPADLMPGFFRVAQACFPITYGMGAMREALGGFYDGYYLVNMLALAAFALASLVVALALGSPMLNLNRLFGRKFESGGIFRVNGSNAEYGKNEEAMIKAMFANGEAREEAIWHAWSFERKYRRVKLLIPIASMLIPVLLIVAMAVLDVDIAVKTTMLLAFVGILIALFCGIVALEYTHDSLNHQLRLARVSRDEARVAIDKGARHSARRRQ